MNRNDLSCRQPDLHCELCEKKLKRGMTLKNHLGPHCDSNECNCYLYKY